MISVRMGYPSRENEARVLVEYGLPGRTPAAASIEVIEPGALERARVELADVHVSDALIGYVLDIVAATRQSSSIGLGLSSRAALALSRCARVEAALRGGEFVVPDDVKRVAPWVIPHRMVLTPDAVLDGLSTRAEVERLLRTVAVPRETP
jgi:MoxR-like ATPase